MSWVFTKLSVAQVVMPIEIKDWFILKVK